MLPSVPLTIDGQMNKPLKFETGLLYREHAQASTNRFLWLSRRFRTKKYLLLEILRRHFVEVFG